MSVERYATCHNSSAMNVRLGVGDVFIKKKSVQNSYAVIRVRTLNGETWWKCRV